MIKLYFQDRPKELGVSCFDICALMAQLSAVQLSDANSSCGACAAECPLAS